MDIGNAAYWARSDSILGPGEQGLNTDTGEFRYGDGHSLWPDLPSVGVASTGWGNYVDSQYTEAEPLQLAADTATLLDNDALGALTNEDYLPIAGQSLYNAETHTILGYQGDAKLITLDFKAKPTNANTTYIEHWIDIGGSVGELYRRISSFPKGNGVERPIVTTTAVYTLDTWEQNGGQVFVQANNTCDIYDLRFVIFRVHRARD